MLLIPFRYDHKYTFSSHLNLRIFPFQRGSTNEVSTSVCDAGVLGELFRHLHKKEQIPAFLQAFEDLRQKHVKVMLDADLANHEIIAMALGEAHEARDASMREKYQAGLSALTGNEDDYLAATWEVVCHSDTDPHSYTDINLEERQRNVCV